MNERYREHEEFILEKRRLRQQIPIEINEKCKDDYDTFQKCLKLNNLDVKDFDEHKLCDTLFSSYIKCVINEQDRLYNKHGLVRHIISFGSDYKVIN